MIRPFVIGLPVAAATFTVDQLTKHWILDRLAGAPWQEQYLRINGVLNFVLAMNHGVTFGMFDNDGRANAAIFAGIALAVAIGLVIWLRKVERALVAVAIGLIVGGAIGNLVDRIRLGAVIDFIDAHWGVWHWYIFNVADSAIDTGVGLLLLDSLLAQRKSPT